ncbi:Hypothetical protein NTJ_01940 [Nesidiocoris tenuis]|uniref:Senescence domain-containing protein n=1 Tax=Nesidiocoris tenuis TaxID=355587 RepID=A0ABN7AAT9_9HEMI|nr:Hypothetical protein NTJ_01940 [Nesidiocoris tenuis]
MKAALFIGFLAIYGCVAQKDEEGKENTGTTGNGVKLPSFSVPSVGKILSKIDSTSQDLLKDKHTIVTSALGLGDNLVNGAATLTGKAVDQGATLAKTVITDGSKIAKTVVTDSQQLTDKAFDMVGKYVPVAGKTIAKLGKAISGYGYTAANKVVSGVESGATSGVTFGNEMGKKVTDAIVSGSKYVKETTTSVHDTKTKYVTSAISKGVKGASSAVKGVGDGISSIGKLISTSSTLEASSTPEA